MSFHSLQYRNWFLGCIVVLCVIAIYTVYSAPLQRFPIRSDGYGYYLYLPATFIHNDLTLKTAADLYFDGVMPHHTGANLYYEETGSFVIKYPVGEAVMLSPFFFSGWFLALVSGAPQDGFSAPFQYTAAVSGAFYGFVGLVLLWRFLAKRFEPTTVAFSLMGILFGTNLFHFMTYDSIFSHAYSFFLFSAFLYMISEYLYDENSPFWSWLLMGMGMWRSRLWTGPIWQRPCGSGSLRMVISARLRPCAG